MRLPMEDRNVLLSKATLITVLLFVSTLAHKANQMSPGLANGESPDRI